MRTDESEGCDRGLETQLTYVLFDLLQRQCLVELLCVLLFCSSLFFICPLASKRLYTFFYISNMMTFFPFLFDFP